MFVPLFCLQRMSLLEQERDSLLDKLVDYNKMLHGEKLEREQLQKQLKVYLYI